MEEIVRLLVLCGWDEKATWFRQKEARLRQLGEGSIAFKEELKELKNVIVGMGSFSDLPLYPKKDAGLTEQEARARQWDLTEELGNAIREALR